MNEAIELDASAIIAYHPIIFSGIKKMDPTQRVPRVVMQYAESIGTLAVGVSRTTLLCTPPIRHVMPPLEA